MLLVDDLREAVEKLEEIDRIVRRVFGRAHPLTTQIEKGLGNARAALRARKTPPTDARQDGDLDEVDRVNIK